MKRILIIIFIISMVGLASCGDNWLDREPDYAIPTSEKLTLNGVEAYANGLYGILRDEYHYGGRFLYFGDVRGDDMQANGVTKRVANAYSYRYTAENMPTSYWLAPYNVIRNANRLLYDVDDIETFDKTEEAIRTHAKGQALAMRAWSYFDICKLFGAPYLKDDGASFGASILDPMDIAPEYNTPKRNTVKETYQEVIIPDLLEAIPLLYSEKKKAPGQITSISAKLLLARVYLYCGEWENAFDYAEQVIKEHKKAGYRLWTKEEYSETEIWKSYDRSEALLELMFSATDRQPNRGISYLNYESGYDDQILTDSFVKSWDPDDVRFSSVVKGKKSQNKPSNNDLGMQRYFTVKYSAPSSNPRTGSIILLRVSEAYLIAAEAGIEVGGAKAEKGLEYYNVIRERAGLGKKSEITTDDVLEERRFEFYAEGHRAFDLLRRNRTIKRVGEGHYPQLIQEQLDNIEIDWNDNHSILGIPQRELRSNPEIRDQQNPGW